MSESTPEDRAEQEATVIRDAATASTPDLPLEAPDADAAEQAATLDLDEDERR